MDSAVIDLPEPDSPAMHKRLAGGDVEGEAVDDDARPLGSPPR